MTDKQPAVETQEPVAQPTEPVANAQNTDDLDTLLSQYEQEVRPSPPEPQYQPQYEQQPQTDPFLEKVKQKMFNDEVNATVDAVVGDMKVPRRVAIGWLDQMARENPAIQRAWLNKDNDPRTWKRFEKTLSAEMKKEFASFQIDEAATADKEAVAAAVRGASNKAPVEPAPNLGSMSDAQLQKYKEQLFG